MFEKLAGFAPLLDYRYWTNPRPVPLGPTLVGGIFMFFGWFLIAALALRVGAGFMKQKDEIKAEVLMRLSWLIGRAGGLGLLLLFFSHEQIPLLGMRFWFLVLFVWFVVRLAFIAVYVVRDMPKEIAEREERQRKERYMPHPKKH